MLLCLAIIGSEKLFSFSPPSEFLLWLILASCGQIVFTIVLGLAMDRKNFGTTIALSKTDALQAALAESLLLGLYPEPKVIVAITIGCFAILVIMTEDNVEGPTYLSARFQAIMLGLLAGLCLGFCSVLYRLAMEALNDFDFLERAVLTSSLATIIQTIVMGAFLLFLRPSELVLCAASWRVSSFVGIIAASTTFLWFTAFGLMNVSSVRMLGQIEILLSFLAGFWLFKERVALRECAGAALIMVSICLLLY